MTNVNLAAVGSAITSTSSVSVPTTGQVVTFVNRFKQVATTDPSDSDGVDGDFYFVREA